MGALFTTVGRQRASTYFQGGGVAGGDELTVVLFKAAHEPAADSNVPDFTESTFGGYDPITFTYGDNTGPTIVGDDAFIRLKGEPLIWDCDSDPETIFGWLLIDGGDGSLLAAEQYETPHVLEVGSRHTLFIDIKYTSP